MITFAIPYLTELSTPGIEVPGLAKLISTYLNDHDPSKIVDRKFLVLVFRDSFSPNLGECVPKLLKAITTCVPELKPQCIISHSVPDKISSISVSFCHFTELNGVIVEFL